MSSTAVELETMIMLVLSRDTGQVAMTRCLIRAALEYRGLETYIDDAEAVTSELVTNAIQHGTTEATDKIGVTLLRDWDTNVISIVVSDQSPTPPVKRETTAVSEHGRGLHLVEALSARWAWMHEGDGKAVYAILASRD